MKKGLKMTERRKWHTNMSFQEKYQIQGIIYKFNNWTYSKHALLRMAEKQVTQEHIDTVLKQGKLFEVHNNNTDDVLAVMRCTIKNSSYAVVLSLVTGLICTVYRNTIESGNRKPDMSAYKWKVDLTKITGISTDTLSAIR